MIDQVWINNHLLQTLPSFTALYPLLLELSVSQRLDPDRPGSQPCWMVLVGLFDVGSDTWKGQVPYSGRRAL